MRLVIMSTTARFPRGSIVASLFRLLSKFAILAILLGAGCAQPEPGWVFTDVTDESGLGGFRHTNGADGRWYMPETIGAGAAFLDYNSDGHIDIALVAGKTWDDSSGYGIRLYQGNGLGRFTDATESAGLAAVTAYGMGLIAADTDNDGDEDLYLTALGRNHFFANEGGRFRDATGESGLDTPPEWTVAAIFLDVDRDGWLDLYVTGYVNWTSATDLFCTPDGTKKRYCTPEQYEGTPARLFMNQGNGQFEERTAESGAKGSGKALGAIAVDVNRDRWPDIAIANDTDPDELFLNRGDGTFEEIGLRSGFALDVRGRARAGMGIDAGVVDPTGETTIFIGHFENQMNGVYRYAPSRVFEERGPVSGIGSASLPTLTFGMLLFDGDLDGDLDLLAANGHINPQAGERNEASSYAQLTQLFLNDGSGHFTETAATVGLTMSLVGRGVATADVDSDGDLDLLVTENNGRARLLRNDLPPGANWLRVRLVGRDIDARITVWAGGLVQNRRIRAGHSFASQSEKTATFGLGSREIADSVLVQWPSGTDTHLYAAAVNQTLVVEKEHP